MKILVKQTYSEVVNSRSSRCSDGHYRQSKFTRSLNVYSDTEKISVHIAQTIVNYINDNTHHGTDEVWDWSYKGESTEKFDLDLTKKLIELLPNKGIEECNDTEECNILLNSIAPKICDSHKSILSDFKNKQFEIQKKFQEDTLRCKAECASKYFNDHENFYPLNEKMPDFEEFPLDIARHKGDIILLDNLISKGAISVSDPYLFAGWLCKVGKFEHLGKFIDLSKLKPLKSNVTSYSGIDLMKSWLIEQILFYSIVHNKLGLFEEINNEYFNNSIKEIFFTEDYKLHSGPKIKIGQIAVRHSNLKTIKKLFDKYNFYVGVRNKWDVEICVLDEYCFRDIETASFFVKKLMCDSLYSLLYWKKNDILYKLLKLPRMDFSKIYLITLSSFFDSSNNSIIEHLASINAFSLTKTIHEIDYDFKPKCYPYQWIMNRSVLDKCAENKNFDLLRKLISISLEKGKIESFDACRLLFMICKYDENTVANDLKQLVMRFIEPKDLMMLLGVACIENNPRLLNFLISQIKDINSSIDIEPTLFGLEAYNGLVNNINKEYKKGTLLHLSLIANPNKPGGRLNTEIIKILLDAGVDKSIKDESGKRPFDYIRPYYYKDEDIPKRNELVKMLYCKEIKICSEKGELFEIFKNTELPIVKRFERYVSKRINAIKAFKTDNKKVLNFFISCGANLESLKATIEMEKSRHEKKYISNNYNDSYSEKELRDMYRDAFNGLPDATWNVD